LPIDFAELPERSAQDVRLAAEAVVNERWAGERPDFTADRDRTLREQSLHLALAAYRARGAPALRVAAVLHRLAWCAREQGDEPAERACLQEALAAYERGLTTLDSADPREELRVQYLCGELARRLGDRAAAVAWFARLLGCQAVKDHPTWEHLAREQWAEARQS
jgi:uncharacterized protein